MPRPITNSLSSREARWLAIAAQGLSGPRPALNGKRPGRARLDGVLDQVGTIQLDAVSAVTRTQFLVPFSRIGNYDAALLTKQTGPGRPWFEYWGHAASLMPARLHPLFRWRMARWRTNTIAGQATEKRRQEWRTARAKYIASVLQEVAERGPLAASQLSEPRRNVGEWWDRRSDGRRALELLFGDGILSGWRTPSFERVYDLTERVIPPEVLAEPTPSEEEAHGELLVLAARHLGVATVTDLADYFWINPTPARLRVTELVDEGRLTPVTVEGWPRTAYALPDARPRRPRPGSAALLSPFDSLIWNRARTERLFHFRYRIEIYVPAPQRQYGYYVLPLLSGDELVARLDLKADRKASVLRVAGAYNEDGAAPAPVSDAAITELHRMKEWLQLGTVSVGRRGNLADSLRRASRSPA